MNLKALEADPDGLFFAPASLFLQIHRLFYEAQLQLMNEDSVVEQ